MDFQEIEIYGIKMSIDASIALISGIIIFTFLIATYGFKLGFLFILSTSALTAYQINCMLTGGCNLFARYMSIITIVNAVFLLFYLSNPKTRKTIGEELKI
jgi:hypothetical protein